MNLTEKEIKYHYQKFVQQEIHNGRYIFELPTYDQFKAVYLKERYDRS